MLNANFKSKLPFIFSLEYEDYKTNNYFNSFYCKLSMVFHPPFYIGEYRHVT